MGGISRVSLRTHCQIYDLRLTSMQGSESGSMRKGWGKFFPATRVERNSDRLEGRQPLSHSPLPSGGLPATPSTACSGHSAVIRISEHRARRSFRWLVGFYL